MHLNCYSLVNFHSVKRAKVTNKGNFQPFNIICQSFSLSRYYYDKNIMTKVHGKRYAYKFDFHGLIAACHQQTQGLDATANMIQTANYKYNNSTNLNMPCDLSLSTIYNTSISTTTPTTSMAPGMQSSTSLSAGGQPILTTSLPSLMSATASSTAITASTSANVQSSIPKSMPNTSNPSTIAGSYQSPYWPY